MGLIFGGLGLFSIVVGGGLFGVFLVDCFQILREQKPGPDF